MDDEGIGTLVVIGIIIVAVIVAVILLGNLINALGKNYFWFGMLVGIPVGVGGTLGFIRIRKWVKTHRVVEVQEKDK